MLREVAPLKTAIVESACPELPEVEVVGAYRGLAIAIMDEAEAQLDSQTTESLSILSFKGQSSKLGFNRGTLYVNHS